MTKAKNKADARADLPALDEGEVAITLGDTVRILTPSVGAARGVNSQFGNFVKAQSELFSMNFDAYVHVVRIGLNLKADDKDAIRRIERQVYEAGVQNLVKPLVEYVGILANGGRPQPKRDEEDDADADDAAAAEAEQGNG